MKNFFIVFMWVFWFVICLFVLNLEPATVNVAMWSFTFGWIAFAIKERIFQ